MIIGKVRRLINIFKEEKLSGILLRIKEKFSAFQVGSTELYAQLFGDKIGIEIGGPSAIFKKDNLIPIYPFVKRVDGCNFSNKTVWEGELIEGLTYEYSDNQKGLQYICDGTDLKHIEDQTYDFVLSSHSLEHIANPLRAIQEWLRILRKDGVLVLVLPDKRYTFDHKRSITTFTHLLDDLNNQTSENDLTHLDEIFMNHDLSLDNAAGNMESFKKRSFNNYENRCIHHHVFDENLLKEIFTYFNINIINSGALGQFHLVIMGKKSN